MTDPKCVSILHIGNIANNAYNNAKLLNNFGYKNDVICYDYYHIMGCPEWEEADFRKSPTNHFFPSWGRIRKRGYKRPIWFVQGPLKLCIAFLMAKSRGRKLATWLYWKELEVYREIYSFDLTRTLIQTYNYRHYHLAKFRIKLKDASRRITDNPVSRLLARSSNSARSVLRLLTVISHAVLNFDQHLDRWFQGVAFRIRTIGTGLSAGGYRKPIRVASRQPRTWLSFIRKLMIRATVLLVRIVWLVLKIVFYIPHFFAKKLVRGLLWLFRLTDNEKIQMFLGRWSRMGRRIDEYMKFSLVKVISRFLNATIALIGRLKTSVFQGLKQALILLIRLTKKIFEIAWFVVRHILFFPFRLVRFLGRWSYLIVSSILGKCRKLLASMVRAFVRFLHAIMNLWQKKVVDDTDNLYFEERVEELLVEWNKFFPERQDKLSRQDIEPYRSVIRIWKNLFDHYDVLMAYSTDPILPMICGNKYFALEHGTLRTIPFEQNAVGRLTALAYAKSEHCFVTNHDCLANARLLASDRVTMINHPYDEDHGLNTRFIEKTRKRLLKKLDSDFLFFFPTRQDWISGTGYADKANDVFLNAFIAIRNQGYRAGMVCCSWGKNVNESKELLLINGVANHVMWVPPLGIVEFNRYAGAADLVIDQFMLGAFGGILFKAMSMGSPICTYLDEKAVLSQYPELPPVVNCSTTQEIIDQVIPLLQSSEKLAHLSKLSRDWIKKYHGSKLTVEAQVIQFNKMLEFSPPKNENKVSGF